MSPPNQTWTVLSILNTTSDYFNKLAVENPRLNAERLLARVLKSDRLQLYLQFDRILNNHEVDEYRMLVRRRANHEPLQYLMGETEFMGLPYKVNPSVLIPRPETEILVESVLALRDQYFQKAPVLWDIGTGSGCIAISLAHLWPDIRIVASDISDQALIVAEENARLNHVCDSIMFVKHDIFREEPPDKNNIEIIVSNPPYISQEELSTLAKEVRDHEPVIALTDAGDGLVFYRRILELIEHCSKCKFVLLEMSGTQPDALIALLKDYPVNRFSTIPDLNGHKRVLKLEL